MNARTLRRAFLTVAIGVGLVLGAIGGERAPAHAVVGGAPIPIEQVPWQAVVYIEADNRLCGGSIIDARWIVTAAHCVADFDASQVEAHVGVTELRQRSNENVVKISEVIVHPSWDSKLFRNDVALLGLAQPIAFDASQQPIALPVGLDAASWPQEGSAASISGWGATNFGGAASNVLRAASLRILSGPSDEQCGRYGDDFDVAVEICAGLPDASVDACQGDSGSPLVVNVDGTPVLAGLTSVGFECARVGFPGIYTRLTTFIPWLQEYLLATEESPTVPQQVQVTALSGERIRVDWLPPRVAPATPITGYRVVVEPTGAGCATGPEARACVIDGVPAGSLYTVTVLVTDGDGSEQAAEPLQVVSVDGVTSVGVRIRPQRLVQWAGLRAREVDDIKLAVRPASDDVCSRVGSAASARGVRAQAVGVCAVRVTVERPDGDKRRAIAYVQVR